MANEKKITMTQEGYDALVKELEWRKGEERERIKNDIVVARGFGDLSENAEYDAARNAQAENEARIQQLSHDIEHAVVFGVDEKSAREKGVVGVGSKVRVLLEGNNAKEFLFHIVGSNEVDAKAGKISDVSPVGSALVGHTANDLTCPVCNKSFTPGKLLDLVVTKKVGDDKKEEEKKKLREELANKKPEEIVAMAIELGVKCDNFVEKDVKCKGAVSQFKPFVARGCVASSNYEFVYRILEVTQD